MASSGVRRADTTKGPPLRILSLDGGGVRGYSMLILVQELMHRTYVEMHGEAPKRHEIPKPCDHFDLIVGTGTGGLIAIMLGRLRLDLETCKDVYVRMTRRVFETDKTFAGIPFKSTLFKASKLEDAIRDCVREHTVFDDEGNDSLAMAQDLTSPASPNTPASAWSGPDGMPARSASTASRPMSLAPSTRNPVVGGRWGNPNALLYDVREKRTKTAVTAVYKKSPRDAKAALLRSYDSRREAPPEFNCTIWQAGRATSAIGLAFKPMQIGQSVFHDEGQGKFNPSPQALDEATLNEYPGRDVGVFVSIGTGKRPGGTDSQQHQWWESFVGGAAGDFAEARRRLMAKIEGCEETHQYMVKEHLSKRGVNIENYYRLNVEVGVGEFGMNEWNRLSEISTTTRMYLGKQDVQQINQSAASKLARINNAKLRWDRGMHASEAISSGRSSWQESVFDTAHHDVEAIPPSNPLAVELPADEGFSEPRPSSQLQSSPPRSPRSQHAMPYKPPYLYQRAPTGGGDKLSAASEQPARVSDEFPTPLDADPWRRQGSYSPSVDGYSRPPAYDAHPPPTSAPVSAVSALTSPGAPPLPPKSPIRDWPGAMYPGMRPPGTNPLPYPDDAPPPPVNMAKKPQPGMR